MANDIFKKKSFSFVEGNTGLIRDNHSKAILNTDDYQRNEFRKKRIILKQRLNQIKKLNQEQQDKIYSLEKEVENLKKLVLKIIEE